MKLLYHLYKIPQHPELALQETETAKYIAKMIKSFGFDVVDGIGKTGMAASMTLGDSKKSIGLRADFDALPIQEVNKLDYKSRVDGIANLCGHDGHTTMLLGAAKFYLGQKISTAPYASFFNPPKKRWRAVRQ